MVKKNILGTIGTTPMVRINRLCPNPNVKIFAKLEGFNPTGSIKDRIALRMIEAAERDGRLTPGKTIIEPTSGNTGIGLAIVGIVKGYPVEIVMSEAVSVERRKIIRAYGGKVRLTPAAEGTDGAIRLARKKVADAPGRRIPTNILCPTSSPMPPITWRITKTRRWRSGSRPAARSTTWSARSGPPGR